MARRAHQRGRQPQGVVPINSANRLAKDLVIAVSGAAPTVNLATRTSVVSSTGLLTEIGSGIGRGATFASTGNAGVRINSASPITGGFTGGGGFTVLVLANPPSSTTQFLSFTSGRAVQPEFYLSFNRTSAGTTEAGCFSLESDGARGRTASGLLDGKPHVFVAVAPSASAGPDLYFDGVAVGGTTIGPSGGAYTSAASSDYYAGYVSSGVSVTGFQQYLTLVWNRPLSADEVRRISANPWQLFRAPQRRQRDVIAGGGGDITLALSGAAVAASAGSFANSRTVAASGSAATANAGTLGLSSTVALAGIAANASAGLLVPSRTVALSGQAVSAFAGTITYSISGDITLALSGQSVTVAAGTVVPTYGRALSGVAVAASAGSVSPAVSAALAGVAVAASAGTVTPSRTVALAGSGVSALAGTVIYAGAGDVIVALSGAAVVTYAGTLTIAPSFTSSAVLYVPIRMVSGLWSASDVTASTPSNAEAWLPPQRQPIAYMDQRTGAYYCDPNWYRAFEFVFETRLGGRGAPSLPDVVTTVTETQATAAASSAAVADVAQQTQANAEALSVTRQVVKNNGLLGSEQIPDVEL